MPYFQILFCPTEGIFSNSATICATHFSDPCAQVWELQNLKGHQYGIIDLKVTGILLNRSILHIGGVASVCNFAWYLNIFKNYTNWHKLMPYSNAYLIVSHCKNIVNRHCPSGLAGAEPFFLPLPGAISAVREYPSLSIPIHLNPPVPDNLTDVTWTYRI